MKLVSERGSFGQAVWMVPQGESTIGRGFGCDLVLADPTVSRRHARLLRDGVLLRIENISSKNPLWRNGEKVDSAPLACGDLLELGRSKLRVMEDSAEIPSPGMFTTRGSELDLSKSRKDLVNREARLLDREKLDLVGEVVEAVPRLGSRESFCEKLMQALFRILDIKRAFVALRDGEEGLRTIVSHNLEPSGESVEIQVSRALLEKTLREKRAQIIPATGIGPAGEKETTLVGVQSALCVPILFRGDTGGILYADHPSRSVSFNDEDLGFLAMLGRLAGVILENLEYCERLNREIGVLRSALQEGADFISTSPAMEPVTKKIRLVARSDANVLITGKSGTGKEVAARSIHNLSDRKDGPFVAVNCAAIPESLLESELFGLAPRSGVSGAPAEGRPGKFEQAQGGTLFLDEIGDMSPGTQARILRALEGKTVDRIGGTEPIPVDLRILAATNKDLEEVVREGKFRPDLLFRLQVVEIRLPALRERPEDILPLAESFLLRLAGGRVVLGREARECLLGYSWPGNVRELKNAMERAHVLCEGSRILPEHLPEKIRNVEASEKPRHLLSLEEVEREHLSQVLSGHGGNVAQAAKVLGIARSTLYSRLKRYGLEHLIS